MDQFHTIFVATPQYRVVVCKECGIGVVKAHIATHLDKKHTYLTPDTRRDLAQIMQAMGEIAESESDVLYPELAPEPIAHIAVWRDGLKCTRMMADQLPCYYICRSLRDIQAHCRTEHGWVNPRKRGRAPKGQQPEANKMWIEGVCCQKFAHAGRMGRLFEVNAMNASVHDEEEEEVRVRQRLETTFGETTAMLEEADREAHARIEPDTNRFITNAWLNRTGWAHHLAGLNRDWLLEQTQRPKKSEKALAKVCWAVETVIWKAQKVSTPQVVGFPAMNYINRREMGNDTNEKPFNARQTGKTMIKYAGWWTSIVRYIWRTHELEVIATEGGAEEAEEEEEGRDSRAQGASGMRPRYHMTAGQISWLYKIRQVVGRDEEEGEHGAEHSSDEEEEEFGEAEEELLESHVLAWLISLLDHHSKDDAYKSAFISATAVLGIDSDRGWKDAMSFPPIISAIVTIARMLVLYRAASIRAQRVAEIVEKDGFAQEDAEEFAPCHFELVQGMADRFMTLTRYGGKPSPMDWLLRLRTYGMKIRFSTNADGVVQWVGDTMLLGHIQFSMQQLRSMIHGLVETARIHLYQELLLLDINEDGQLAAGATILPEIPWDDVVDNPAEMRSGWSFLDDPRNTFGGVDGKTWLTERIIQEKRLREGFVDVRATDPSVRGGRGVVWQAKRVAQYEKAMRACREHLIVLMHMTGGQPARGSEVVTVQYKNSANGESRGVFVEDGLMVYVTMYHKNIGASAKAKVIYRYLPREVGTLLFYYLWMAVPFWRKLAGAAHSRAIQEASPFIWEPKKERPWAKPQRVKRRIPVEPEDGSDVEDGIVSEQEAVEEEQSHLLSSAPETWDTNRVRRAIQRASVEWMGVKLNILGWRHGSKAIYRRYINDKAIIKTVVQGDEEIEDGEDDAFDLQTGHSSHVGRTIYGRSAEESPFSNEAERLALRRVSTEWHRFLLFDSALEARPKKGTWAAEARRQAIEEDFRRWKQMRAVDVQAQLEKLVGAGAVFRGVQKDAIEAIMQQKSPIVVIMSTGAGKSMSFMLPASCSTGVTIVVVPLISLRGDLKDRCRVAGIECVEWDSRKPQEWASIVLVTPESTVSESFGRFINRQRAMGRLDRIVVDECHVVLDSTRGWRSRILALRNLVMAETQLVYLTATMQPRDEGEFIQLMGLPPKEQCQWFRGSTTRKNVAYQVHLYDEKKETEEEVVSRLVEEKKQQYPMPGQIIVYCDSVAKTVHFAKVLGGVCYHRQVGSRGVKADLVRQLTEGRQQVFIATNALGLGVDAPTIRVVIHVGVVRKVKDYAQESGRAGRDGLRSEAIIVWGVRYDRSGRVQEKGWAPGVEEGMQGLITTQGCRRVLLDREIDGRKNRVGCEEGEEWCDRCRVEQTVGERERREESPVVNVVIEEGEREAFEVETRRRRALGVHERACQSAELVEVQEMEERLEIWRDGCPWCRVWDGAWQGHGISECSRVGVEEVRKVIELMRDMIRWERFSGCFDCGVPQAICEDFEATEEGYRKKRGRYCQYKGVLIETVASIWGRWDDDFSQQVQWQMQQEGEVVGEKVEFAQAVKWFGKKIRWGGLETNKMCWVFWRGVRWIEGS